MVCAARFCVAVIRYLSERLSNSPLLRLRSLRIKTPSPPGPLGFDSANTRGEGSDYALGIGYMRGILGF